MSFVTSSGSLMFCSIIRCGVSYLCVRKSCAVSYSKLSAIRLFKAVPAVVGKQRDNSLDIICRCFCSNSHIVEMRGLDYEATEEDVIDFFRSLRITPTKIRLRCDITGRSKGLCEVEFSSHAEAVVAMRKKSAFIGNRFIRLILRSSVSEDEDRSHIYTKSDLENLDERALKKSSTSGYHVHMRNLPARITEQAIFHFFWPLNIRPVSVKPIYDESGSKIKEYDVEFFSYNDAVKALSKNNMHLGHRAVELTLSVTDTDSTSQPELLQREANGIHC